MVKVNNLPAILSSQAAGLIPKALFEDRKYDSDFIS
jgi:hypothetical protein